MYKKDLQLFLGKTILESKMSKTSKLQLLTFVESEASEEQLMVLYLDGKIVKLDEQSKEIVRHRFKSSISEGPKLGAAAGAIVFAAASGFLIALKAANAIRKRFLTQTGRVCSGLEKNQKRVCILKLKVASIKQQITIFDSKKSSCGKDEKCQNKFNQKINKLKSDLQSITVS